MAEHLIELVRCEPCLYDTNHPDYSRKTLKDSLWVRIAKKLNYEDGPSAKDAWLKLRNCHRDAIRRRNKLHKTGSADIVTKPWKFENQMEFLVSYMTNRSTIGNTTTENLSHQNHIQLVDICSINYQEDEDEDEFETKSSQILPPNITRHNSYEDSVAASQLLPSPISQKNIKESTIKKTDTNTLIGHTLQNHENSAKERGEKRAHFDEVDEMQLFFNTMYAMTKKMPALSQHKLKRRIFNLVFDEEEYLLHLESTKPSSSDTPVPSPTTPMPSSATLVPSPDTIL
ncbi:uncharacterized protein LOC123872070 [Maniola jurtina]|uniref:uncharacterized protein LOC123872070 n=1 Tax=Maniola jurtina TaxID=191418 RepID=UPI001E68F55E|nr:uncharacterized protein LOC123872070 [Maniola jurtina]